jgi:hypothetical protein
MKFDAVLVHGYWLSIGKKTGPSVRTRLAIAAAGGLYRNDMVSNIVISAGPIWGKAYPSVGLVMKRELQARYGVPGKRIIMADRALSTKAEIDMFQGLARKRGWLHSADVAFSAHHWTIPLGYRGRLPEFLHIEDVIKKWGSGEDRQMLARLMRSRYEFNFRLYEAAIRLVQVIDRDYKLMPDTVLAD